MLLIKWLPFLLLNIVTEWFFFYHMIYKAIKLNHQTHIIMKEKKLWHNDGTICKDKKII